MPKIVKLIPFFFACSMFLKALFETVISNMNKTNLGLNYVLSDSTYIGGAALLIIGVSIFLKRNIWTYLFAFTLLLAFSEMVDFSNYTFNFFIGGLRIDLTILMILLFHLGLNLSDMQLPDLTPKEIEEQQELKTNKFLEKYSKKTHEQLLKLEQEDLVPEAREALDQLLGNK